MPNHPFGSDDVRLIVTRSIVGCIALLAISASFRAGRNLQHPVPAASSTTTSRKVTLHQARTRPAGSNVDEQSGIEIIAHTQRDMFPADWTDPASPTTASTPAPEFVPVAVEGIKRALRKYPTPFLKRNLTRIYIVNNLLVDGQPSGGVNAPELKTIYVDLDNLDLDEVAAWSEETIHHEFAHLLADNHPANISMQSWAILNKSGFKYGTGGTDAIRSGKDGDEITSGYLSRGFVEEYSESAPDEDFATLCERMFSGDRKVQQAVARYPMLRRKANRVIAFYHSLDPSFTDVYFKTLRPSRK